MKSTLRNFGNTHILCSKSPIVSETYLLGVNLGRVIERLCEKLAQPFSTKVLDTNFLMASTFPGAYPCMEFIQDCIQRHDIRSGNILKKDKSILLNISRVIVSKLFHLEEKEFADLTPTLSWDRFLEKPDVYRNAIVKS